MICGRPKNWGRITVEELEKREREEEEEEDETEECRGLEKKGKMKEGREESLGGLLYAVYVKEAKMEKEGETTEGEITVVEEKEEEVEQKSLKEAIDRRGDKRAEEGRKRRLKRTEKPIGWMEGL